VLDIVSPSHCLPKAGIRKFIVDDKYEAVNMTEVEKDTVSFPLLSSLNLMPVVSLLAITPFCKYGHSSPNDQCTLKETCSWLLSHSTYKTWQKSQNVSLD